MSNFAHALNLATDLAAFMFPDVSDNRRTGSTELATRQRNFKNQELARLRGHASNPQYTLMLMKQKKYVFRKETKLRRDVVNYGQAVFEKGDTGNCHEIACAGAYLLSRRYDVDDWDLIIYPDYDHVFLAIGDTGGYPDDFNAWPADTAIFDGWAQIACEVRHYKVKWAAKMNDWTASSHPVELPSISTFGFGDATGWRPVVDAPKASFFA